MNREGKKYQITAGFGINYSVPSTGFNIGYFIDKKQLVSLRYRKMAEVEHFVSENGSYSDQARSIGVFHKSYFGNSFYVDGGLSHLQVDRVYRRSPELNGEYSEISGHLAIGNQWQWENFTLGCDWVGVNYRFIKLDKGVAPDHDHNLVSTNANAVELSATVLNFYIGASF